MNYEGVSFTGQGLVNAPGSSIAFSAFQLKQALEEAHEQQTERARAEDEKLKAFLIVFSNAFAPSMDAQHPDRFLVTIVYLPHDQRD